MHTPGAPPLSASSRVPRGHARAQGRAGKRTLSKIQCVRTSLRTYPRVEKGPRFRESTDPRAPIYCGGTPRGRLTECSEVAAVLERWGAEDISGDLGDLCSSEQCPRLGL